MGLPKVGRESDDMRRRWWVLAVFFGFAMVMTGAHPALAEGTGSQGVDPAAADSAAAPVPAEPAAPAQELPWQPGPRNIDLGHGAAIDLPEGFAFLAPPHAGQIMQRMGNLNVEDLVGLIVSTDEANEYLVTLRYEESGYIKDDEKLDAEELLESIREGEEEYNAERKKRGFPPLHAGGWDELPRYDQAKHQLIWGLIVQSPEGASINYNTRVLGRMGYLSLNLVTDKEQLARHKPAGALLLSKTGFGAGKRYEDFNDSTDKVAEYGLTGLVLGGAGFGLLKAAKIGLFAKFFKVIIVALAAGKKFVVVGVLALGALLKRLLNRKKDAGTEA